MKKIESEYLHTLLIHIAGSLSNVAMLLRKIKAKEDVVQTVLKSADSVIEAAIILERGGKK